MTVEIIKKSNNVKEILQEIEKRLDGFEGVHSSVWESGLHPTQLKHDTSAAYVVLKSLHSFIEDTWED